jgi:hypothetical protein
MTKRVVILAVAVGLAFASQPALAGSRGGGGHSGGGHSGGGHSGGGHAVARGSGSGYAPHSVAAARHPSGGGGYYSSGHGSYGHGSYGHGSNGHGSYGHGSYGHGSYGHSYYGHSYYGHSHGYYPYYGAYYPYYGGYYGGYYGSGLGLYFGFGGPYAYGSLYYGGPSSYGYPYEGANMYAQAPDAGPEDPGYGRPNDARVQGDYVPNTGRVRLEVRPEDASVYVDDQYWGNASDSRQITLRAGRHVIELVRPGLPVARREVDVIAGQSADVLVDLQQHQ